MEKQPPLNGKIKIRFSRIYDECYYLGISEGEFAYCDFNTLPAVGEAVALYHPDNQEFIECSVLKITKTYKDDLAYLDVLVV